MRKLYYFFAILATLAMPLCTVSCSESTVEKDVVTNNDNKDDKEENKEPEPDKDDDKDEDKEVLVGDFKLTTSVKDILFLMESAKVIDFTAFVGETDLSDRDSLKIFCIDENSVESQISETSYTINKEGIYNFYATYTDTDKNVITSDKTQIEVLNITGFKLVASAEKVTFLKGENSTINFSIFLNKNDISKRDNLKILYKDELGKESEVSNFQFLIEKAGNYSFFATFSDSNGNIITTDIQTIIATEIDTLSLDYSVDYNSSNSNKIEFLVKYGDQILAEFDPELLEIYCKDGVNETKLDINSFEYNSSKFGYYDYYATYKVEGIEINSNKVRVATAQIASIDYIKRALAIQFTGTWCGHCPLMTSAINQFEDFYGKEVAVFVAAHSGDVMFNKYSNYLCTNLEVEAFPSIYIGSVNPNKAIEANYNLSTIVSAVNVVRAEGVATAIALDSEVENDIINVDALIAVKTNGEYGVGAMVLEDNISAPQTSYHDIAGLGITDINNHVNVIQAIYPTSTDIPYENLAGVAEHTSDKIYKFNCKFDAKDLTTLSNIDNCRIVVYTYNKKTGYVDNVMQSPIGTSKIFDKE